MAAALLRLVEQHAAADGIREIAVDAWAANVGAISFFEKCGFTPFNVALRKPLAF
ncbi:MAG: GNAT family N-acetyltransferase [Hyphomicrobiales bacterium]|nr:GNAT family N-acetyltransferase [Hyphomicrobiales bacterium]